MDGRKRSQLYCSFYILSNAALGSIQKFGIHARGMMGEVTSGLGKGLERFGLLAGRIEIAPFYKMGLLLELLRFQVYGVLSYKLLVGGLCAYSANPPYN